MQGELLNFFKCSGKNLIFNSVKKLALILTLLFISFLFTPSLIALTNRHVDISIAFNVNEEESTSKKQVTLEYSSEEVDSNYDSIHFLQTRKIDGHYYQENVYDVCLTVSYPPPKLT